jgi:hypothetical protein
MIHLDKFAAFLGIEVSSKVATVGTGHLAWREPRLNIYGRIRVLKNASQNFNWMTRAGRWRKRVSPRSLYKVLETGSRKIGSEHVVGGGEIVLIFRSDLVIWD